MGIAYDPQIAFWRTLCRCKGSVVPAVIVTPFFNLQLFLHILFLCLDRLIDPVVGWSDGAAGGDGSEVIEDDLVPIVDEDIRRRLSEDVHCAEAVFTGAIPIKSGCEFLPSLDWRAAAAMTSLLTFFIVFYGSQSYTRFRMFYSHTVGLHGTIMNWVCLVRNHLPRDADNLHWNATRLILASLHVMYFTLAESTDGANLSEAELKAIYDRELLTKEEVDRIVKYTGYKPFLPLIWAQREVAAAIEGSTQLPSNDDQLMYHFRELAFQFRGHCGQITNELAEPVPFPYFHMLTFLLFADLLAISWALVTLRIHPALTVTVYVVVLLLFAGLRQVAVDMSNPFGEDEIDVRCPPRTRVGLPATHAASLLTSNVRARVRVPPRSSTSRRSSRRRLITRRLPLPTTGSRTAAPLRL